MARNFIFIGENTSFNGTITAKEVVVKGAVNGEIHASERLVIKNGAVVEGTIQTQKLLFEEGGQHNGLIRLGNSRRINGVNSSGLSEPPSIKDQISLKNGKEPVLKKNKAKQLW